MINKDYVCKLGLEFIDEYWFDNTHHSFVFKHNNICVIVDDNICENKEPNKSDNDPNNNDNNGGTTIYKTELNFENKQEKSRPNSNEFKRLLIGGALVT